MCKGLKREAKMEDFKIIRLLFERDESAIEIVSRQFGSYCRKIAYNVLRDAEDVDECLNDVWMRLWESIPPNEPQSLSAYVATITRNTAIDIYKRKHAEKRIQSEYTASLDELEECIPDDKIYDISDLGDALNRFLKLQSAEARVIFVKRYFFCQNIADIAKACNISHSKVKSSLFRTRNKLKEYLIKENYTL